MGYCKDEGAWLDGGNLKLETCALGAWIVEGNGGVWVAEGTNGGAWSVGVKGRLVEGKAGGAWLARGKGGLALGDCMVCFLCGALS